MIFNLDASKIQNYQQNRYPLLFIDYVEEVAPGVYARGYKNFSYNEWYFPAHFPDEPVVPGFVLIESLTQMFLMTFLTTLGNEGKKTGFVSIENAQFKKKIIPGDRLNILSHLESFKHGIAKGWSKGFINHKTACSIELTVCVPDILNKLKPKEREL